MKFNEFKLSRPILQALREQNYQEPSPIQEQAIPVILAGRDVLGCAQTGTGKTCAFVVPIIEKIMTMSSNKTIKTLILAPTRELAIQIYDNAKQYGKYTNIKICAVYGGVKDVNQKQELSKGVDILIATPGRLLDLMNQKIIDISKINFFVLDEADRMLDMGFINDINKIIKYLPTKRQTLLFSATMPNSIRQLCDQILNNPVNINIIPDNPTIEKINQKVYFVDKVNKIKLLIELIKKESISSALIFSRTKHGADRINKYLKNAGIKSAAIHGDKSQNARQSALGNFKDHQISVLVATDIASRGIDIDNLPYVFNYDLPDTVDTYIHRIGRTARAGKAGDAISFCCIDEMEMLKEIEKTCKVKLTVINHNYEMMIFTKTPPKTSVKKKVLINS